MPACTLNMHFQPTLVFDPWNAHNLNGTSFRETITWCMMVFWKRSPLLNLPPCRPSVWVIARFLLENAVMPKSPNLLLDKTPSWAGQQNLLKYLGISIHWLKAGWRPIPKTKGNLSQWVSESFSWGPGTLQKKQKTSQLSCGFLIFPLKFPRDWSRYKEVG